MPPDGDHSFSEDVHAAPSSQEPVLAAARGGYKKIKQFLI
jgi:hypothetical protein